MHSPACPYHKCAKIDFSSEQYYIYHSPCLFGIACLTCTPFLRVTPTHIIIFLRISIEKLQQPQKLVIEPSLCSYLTYIHNCSLSL